MWPRAALWSRALEGDEFGHREARLSFDDFMPRNVGAAKRAEAGDERSAGAASAEVELPDALRNQVDQDVRAGDFLQRLTYKKRIH